MIKNTTIIILILLLIISFYSYYCMENSMITFKDEEMNTISKKEYDLRIKEKKIGSLTDCISQNELLGDALNKIFNLSKNFKDIIQKDIIIDNE